MLAETPPYLKILIHSSLANDFENSYLSSFFREKEINYDTYDEISAESEHSVLYFNRGIPLSVIADNQWNIVIDETFETFINDRTFVFSNLSDQGIKKILKRINDQYISEKAISIKEDSYIYANEVFKNTSEYFNSITSAIKSGRDSKELEQFIELKLEFLNISSALFENETKESFLSELQAIVSNHNIIVDLLWVRGNDELEITSLDKEGYLFIPITYRETGDYLAIMLSGKSNSLDPSIHSYLYFIVELVFRFTSFLSEFHDGLGEHTYLNDLFNLLPVPISLITSKGEFLLCNQEFIKLEIFPRECLALDNNDDFERDQQIFKVQKREIIHHDQPVYLFYFSSIDNTTSKSKKNVSTEQLGIISSSIAHELNNPIAGVIAALTLLELEDFWSVDNTQTVSEMKKSANRCKKLVDVFLGFSKVSTKKGFENSFQSSFDQALNLLRFRMIEADILLDIRSENTGYSYQKEINTSVGAMVFYLILSEVMTSFSHHKLLGGNESNSVNGIVYEYDDRVEIEFSDNFDFASRINNSKLIWQLVEMEGLGLHVSSTKVIFQ